MNSVLSKSCRHQRRPPRIRERRRCFHTYSVQDSRGAPPSMDRSSSASLRHCGRTMRAHSATACALRGARPQIGCLLPRVKSYLRLSASRSEPPPAATGTLIRRKFSGVTPPMRASARSWYYRFRTTSGALSGWSVTRWRRTAQDRELGCALLAKWCMHWQSPRVFAALHLIFILTISSTTAWAPSGVTRGRSRSRSACRGYGLPMSARAV
jgi:hypothetical protein